MHSSGDLRLGLTRSEGARRRSLKGNRRGRTELGRWEQQMTCQRCELTALHRLYAWRLGGEAVTLRPQLGARKRRFEALLLPFISRTTAPFSLSR